MFTKKCSAFTKPFSLVKTVLANFLAACSRWQDLTIIGYKFEALNLLCKSPHKITTIDGLKSFGSTWISMLSNFDESVKKFH